VSYATDQVHFKHEQPQVLSMESHITIGTIQQTQDSANVLWLYRHNSWHAAWPAVILRFMGTRWQCRPWQMRGLMQDPGAGTLWAMICPQRVGPGGTQI